jgi:hypothetical protein
MTIFTLLMVLTGFAEDECTLYVHVNAPYWGIEKRIDLEIVEAHTEKRHALKGIRAGQPGTFRIEPGEYHLKASGEDFATVYKGPIHILPGMDTKKVTIEFRKGATVSGVVRDPDGAPLSGVRVALGPHSRSQFDAADPFPPDRLGSSKRRAPHSLVTLTGENGEFTIKNVPLEFNDLVMEGAGYRLHSEQLSVTPGAVIIKDLTLERGAPSINLRVLDQDEGPVRKAWACWLDPVRKLITTQNMDHPVQMPWYAGPSSAEGRIEIVDPPPGPLDLWIFAKGYLWKEVRASPGKDLEVVLEPASCRLEIEAVDSADGNLIPGIEVKARPGGSPFSSRRLK